ncbi:MULTISPECIES: acyl carrier protein [Staphylococcus]|mgnify:CR=1 FL=1|uniref:acyl carrier protein n=1 Tax=Staphylococcus TaxID=1279 RepID=UPI0021A44649|nr:acyl carrier protein [Staphylococcus epidermidis]MCT1513179.1 acyl carrier protein [Staphylococcus epidermidis]
MSRENLVLEILGDVLEIDDYLKIDMDMEIVNLKNWDSVNSLRILTYLEEEFYTNISMEKYSEARTVKDLIELTGS